MHRALSKLLIVVILLSQPTFPTKGANEENHWIQYEIHIDEQGNILYKQKIYIHNKPRQNLEPTNKKDEILTSWILEVESWIDSYNKTFGKNCVAKDYQVDIRREGNTTIVARSVVIERGVDQVGSWWVLSEIFTESWVLREKDSLTIELPPGAKTQHIHPKPARQRDRSLYWENTNFSAFEPHIVYTLGGNKENHFDPLPREIEMVGEELRRIKLCGVAGEAGYMFSEAMEHYSTSQELYNMGRTVESKTELEKTKKLLGELKRLGLCPQKASGEQTVGDKPLGVATPLVYLCVTALLAGLATWVYIYTKRRKG